MAITDLFSKKQKRLRGEYPDVYQYEELVQGLLVQTAHIFRDLLGSDISEGYGPMSSHTGITTVLAEEISQMLCREYGWTHLPNKNRVNDSYDIYLNYIVGLDHYEKYLDVVQLTLQKIEDIFGDNEDLYRNAKSKIRIKDAIEELNERFKEHGFGYKYESGQIIRIDSELVHSEVVKPTLALLHGKDYSGANDEFLRAHDHYKTGKYKECLNEALKAFESVMKTICKKRGWTLKGNETAKQLIEICLSNNLIPSFMDNQFNQLTNFLTNSSPTFRNKTTASHGQGQSIVKIPPYYASYMLHMTASNILFLIEAEKAK